jgi:hypothetical protein
MATPAEIMDEYGVDYKKIRNVEEQTFIVQNN